MSKTQQTISIEKISFSGKKIMIGLSGGINSMAVRCWLGELPESHHPAELHLFYADFKEHSDDTVQFVLDGVFWAKSKFEKIIYTQTENSVMDYFEENNFIPHPNNSKCSVTLKIEPMLKYCYQNDIQIDLIGYVRNEVARLKRLIKTGVNDLFFSKEFPIIGHDDNWCFEIVKRNIGWYPAIYDIREKGKRVFKHNNCLPCKNMTEKQFMAVKRYYPEKFERALEVEAYTGKYFGRNEKGCNTGCATCNFD